MHSSIVALFLELHYTCAPVVSFNLATLSVIWKHAAVEGAIQNRRLAIQIIRTLHSYGRPVGGFSLLAPSFPPPMKTCFISGNSMYGLLMVDEWSRLNKSIFILRCVCIMETLNYWVVCTWHVVNLYGCVNLTVRSYQL